MKELKFRAYDKTSKKMLYSDNYPDLGCFFILCKGQWGSGKEWNDVMQFSNRLDKNGKEIFEEDVVIADGKQGTLQWNVSEPFYWVRFGESKFNYLEDVIEIEIIGNRFENPELLK